MKDWRRLSRVNARLYMVLFLVALIFVLINTLFIAWDVGAFEKGKGIDNSIMEQIAEAKKANAVYTLPETGLDLSRGIQDKVSNGSFGFGLTVLGIIFLLFVKELSYTDVRTREFQQTFPVRKTYVVLHEYVYFLLLIVGLSMLQAVMLFAVQRYYNNTWIRLSGVQAVPDGFMQVPDANLFTYMVFYIMELLLIYTWIFLGMTLAKNSLLGGGLAIVTWLGGLMTYGSFSYELIGWFLGKNPGFWDYENQVLQNAEAYYQWIDQYNRIDDFIGRILYADSLIGDMKVSGFMRGIVSASNPGEIELTLTQMFAILAGILLLEIVLLILAAGKRELSKGRLFYFTGVEALFAIFCGVMWFTVEAEGGYFLYVLNLPAEAVAAVMIVSSIAVVLVVLWLLYPVKLKKRERFSVRREKVSVRFSGGVREEVGKLFLREWAHYVLFLIPAIIWTLAIVNASHYYYEFLELENWREWMDRIPESVLSMFDGMASNMIEPFLGDGISFGIIPCLIIILLISKLPTYWQERDSYGRDFHGNLPISRSVDYWFHVVMDGLLLVIPVMVAGCYTAAYDGNVLKASGITISWLPQAFLGLTVIVCAFLLMLSGFLHFMEQMFPNGMMRLIGTAGIYGLLLYMLNAFATYAMTNPVVNTLYGIFTLRLPGGNYFDLDMVGQPGYEHMSKLYAYSHRLMDVPVLLDGESMSSLFTENSYYGDGREFSRLYDFSHVGSYLGYAVLYLVLAAILLMLGFACAKRKELSSQSLYFNFERFLFAGIIAAAFFSVMLNLTVAPWHKALVCISTLFLFVVLVVVLTPDGINRLRRRKA